MSGMRLRAGAPVHWLREEPGDEHLVIACRGFQYGDRRSTDTAKVTCAACVRVMTQANLDAVTRKPRP